MTMRRTRSLPSNVEIYFILCVIAFAACVRLIGVYRPAPTSADEAGHLMELNQRLDNLKAGGSRFAVHYDHHRQFFAQTSLEVLPASVVPSPSRVAFGVAALAGIISIGASAWAARRLFGPSAMWISVVLMSLSLIHTNYSVKVLGVIHAYAAITVALLCFTSRWRSLWGVGAFLLSAAFVFHYNAGVVALALGAAVLISDGWNAESFVGWVAHVTKGRLWVAAVSGSALAGYALLQWKFADFDYASRLISHENLQLDTVHSNFHWVAILGRRDPVVSVCALGVALVLWRKGSLSRLGRIYRSHAPDSFVTPAVIGVAAILLVLILTFVRSLSGMTRQVFLPMAVWQVALAGCGGVAWQVLSDWSRRLALALICVAGSIALALAGTDWLATRGLTDAAIDLKASLARSWPPTAIDSANYLDFLDFLDGKRGYDL